MHGEKLEVPIAWAMPCEKTNNWHRETRCTKDNGESKFACILEASESTRMVYGGKIYLKFIGTILQEKELIH